MSANWKTILIGTSLGESSDAVVRHGAEVARATGATPWLIHVYALPAYPSELAGMDRRWVEEQEDALREALAEQARRTGLADLPGYEPANLLVEPGTPPREISRVAEEIGADLVVVGAMEKNAWLRLVLGSTAEGVIRRLSCPVLVLRSDATFPPRRVEIPVDLSPASENALRLGTDFLARMNVPLTDAEVLFVLNPFEVAGSPHFTAEQIERFAGEELRRFEKACCSGAVPRSHLRTGSAQEEILKTLDERKTDLVVLGTHGRSGFERFVLGSVTVGVMHRAHCSLLVVPPGAEIRRAETEPRDEARTGADWRFVSDETAQPGEVARH
jgi:nucleotide-binding universal stress UspA family protein